MAGRAAGYLLLPFDKALIRDVLLSPILCGFFGDAMGLSTTTLVIAVVALATLSLAWKLNPTLGMGEGKR